MPRVSVIIPTFNCARFISSALKTALSQTYRDYEIIVVDDGSNDATEQVLAPFWDKIQYVYQSNRGLSAARNLALRKASGDLIAYLDADDMWYPSKLEKQVAFLDDRKECGVVHSDITLIDEENNVICPRFNQEQSRKPPEGDCLLSLLRRCHVQILTVLERRDCLERGGHFDERLKTAQDYFHWIKIAAEGVDFGYITEPLAMYRRTPASLSSSNRRVLEDVVIIFESLLTEKSLPLKYAQESLDIIRNRLYSSARDLAYLDRLEGHTGSSVRRLMTLIKRWPFRRELYWDVVKNYLHASLRGMGWMDKQNSASKVEKQ